MRNGLGEGPFQASHPAGIGTYAEIRPLRAVVGMPSNSTLCRICKLDRAKKERMLSHPPFHLPQPLLTAVRSLGMTGCLPVCPEVDLPRKGIKRTESGDSR